STTNPLSLASFKPDIVIEAASQAAVREFAIPLLERGIDLLLMSVGALADPSFESALTETARRVGRRVYLPSGAVGGLDVLKSARVEGLESVTIVTSKAPRALAGAPFFEERKFD